MVQIIKARAIARYANRGRGESGDISCIFKTDCVNNYRPIIAKRASLCFASVVGAGFQHRPVLRD